MTPPSAPGMTITTPVDRVAMVVMGVAVRTFVVPPRKGSDTGKVVKTAVTSHG